jgi:hypothetical protein
MYWPSRLPEIACSGAGEVASVVQVATTAPFIAAGNAPYVVRSVSGCGGPGQSIETWEPLPNIGVGDAASGIEAGVIGVAVGLLG